jgi:hypothetical protein
LKASGRSGGCSVLFPVWDKRASLSLTTRDTVRVPWLGGRYPASSLLRTHPTPRRRMRRGLWRSRSCLSARAAPFEDRRVRRLHAEGKPSAFTRCFTTGAGLVLSDGLATPLSVTRLNRVRLSLRLAPSPRGASCRGSLPRHARSATWLTGHSKVNSFQFTRQKPVSLTHQMAADKDKNMHG